MGYVKIFDSLPESSISEEELHVRWMWMIFLVLCDRNGNVRSTREGLARRANLPQAKADDAIARLTSPDDDSTSSEEEGRRVVQFAPNHWHVVNYLKYRGMKDPVEERAKNRERKRRQREREREAGHGGHENVTESHDIAEAEAEAEAKADDTYDVSASDAEPSPAPEIDEVQLLADEWNEMAGRTGLSKIRVVTKPRRRAVAARIAEYGIDEVRRAIAAPTESAFLRGENGGTGEHANWKASFDWTMKPSNMVKILEDNYRDRGLPPRVDPAVAKEQEEKGVLVRHMADYRAAVLDAAMDLEPAVRKLARQHGRRVDELAKSDVPTGTMNEEFYALHDRFIADVYLTLGEDDVKRIDAATTDAEKSGVAVKTMRRKLVQDLVGLPDPLDFEIADEDG